MKLFSVVVHKLWPMLKYLSRVDVKNDDDNNKNNNDPAMTIVLWT